MRNPYRTSEISWQTVGTQWAHNVKDRNCSFSESYVLLVLLSPWCTFNKDFRYVQRDFTNVWTKQNRTKSRRTKRKNTKAVLKALNSWLFYKQLSLRLCIEYVNSCELRWHALKITLLLLTIRMWIQVQVCWKYHTQTQAAATHKLRLLFHSWISLHWHSSSVCMCVE